MTGPGVAAVQFVQDLADDELRVSAAARDELERIFRGCEDPAVIAVRLFVAGGGCAGMTYSLTFTDRLLDHDRVADAGGLRIFVDAIAFSYLRGAEIDFQRRDSGDAFVFNGVFQATGGSGLCGGCGAALA